MANSFFGAHKYLPVLLAAVLAMAAGGCAGAVKGGAGGKGQAATPLAVDEAAIELILRRPAPVEFKGFGKVNISGAGSGTIEALRRGNGYARAHIYSPFGTAVASMTAEDSMGVVKVGNDEKAFAYGDKMEGVPFPCAKNFTYGQFINSLTGTMPDDFRALPAAPDSLKRSKRAAGKATVVWNSDTLSVRMLLKGKKEKPPQLESVTFRYNIVGGKFSILFANFKNGIAREITVKEGGKNYINVKYESVNDR
jgi:hypothetical protein